MSPWEVVGACAATSIALYLAASWALDLCIRRSSRRRWQQSTTEPARTSRSEADVRDELAEARAALDLTTCLAIWDITQHDIPHQARRTEEDQ